MENYEKTEENLQKAQEKLQQAELRYTQAEHQYKLEQNRQNYCKKRSQKERTHRLITRGVAVEMQHEGLDELTEGEFYDFIEAVFMQSNVQSLTDEWVSLHRKEADVNGSI